MLATLFDFPFEERHKLVEWSDLATSMEQANGGPSDNDEVFRGMRDMAGGLSALWHDKAARLAAGEKPGYDLITLMQMSEDTKDLINRPMEFLGNLILLVVGGNDTTRNSMSGGILALNQFPDEFARLKEDHGLIPKLVHEIIRWQTPLAYMRRIATKDTVLNGQFIRKGDKVVMWYASANRDERTFEVSGSRGGRSFIVDDYPGVGYLDIVPDSRLKPDSCILESEIGLVEASIEGQLAALRNAFQKVLGSRI